MNPHVTPSVDYGFVDGFASGVAVASIAWDLEGPPGSGYSASGTVPQGSQPPTIQSFSAPGTFTYSVWAQDSSGNQIGEKLVYAFDADNWAAPSPTKLFLPVRISAQLSA